VSDVDAAALRAAVERYLDALERFDVPAVLECFTDDAFYSHPPYEAEEHGRRHEVTGHDGLVRLFEHRGPRPDVGHSITLVAAAGDAGFVAGTFSHRGATVGSFVSTVVLARDGRICSYAAYASVPAVGMRPRDALT
jgi:ketosteroid isomerase-like protein